MSSAQKTKFLLLLFALPITVALAQPNSFFSAKVFQEDSLETFPVFSGLSPLLVPSGQVELLFFNTLSTQTNRAFSGGTSRGTALQHILQVTYGVSKNGRFNIGTDIQYLHYRLDGNSNNSSLKVFKSTASDTVVTDANDDNLLALSFHTLSRVGLRFRATPFYSLPELTLQGGVLFPLAYQAPAIERALDLARTQVWLQGNFYHLFGEGLYGFANAGAYFKLPNDKQRQTAVVPVANLVIAKTLLDDFLIVFAQTAFNGNFNKEYKAGLKNTSYQLLYGLGVQVQPSNRFSISAELQKPILNNYKSLTSEYDGGLANFSLNFRYITGK